MRAWTDDLRDQLKRHEGWRGHVYQDSLGFWTIGYGRLVDQSRGGGITPAEGEFLLNNDIDRVVRSLHAQIPWFDRLPPRKKIALANMTFQLGLQGLFGFRRMLHALQHGDWSAARREALDSRWAQQTPARAAEIAAMLGEED
jgi:lysozyme